MKHIITLAILGILLVMSCSTKKTDEEEGYWVYSDTDRVYEYATATVNKGQYVWSEWKKCRVDMILVKYEPIFHIKMPDGLHSYRLASSVEEISEGLSSWDVINQDDKRGRLFMEAESSTLKQLYVFFADTAWIYRFYTPLRFCKTLPNK